MTGGRAAAFGSAAGRRCFAILGLGANASLEEVRASYRRLAKRNHPDLFPDEQRARQQLKMMRVNEAYMIALAELADRRPTAAGREATRDRSSRPTGSPPDFETFFASWKQKARPGAPSPDRSVGALRDPAYAYYKQGFRCFNLGSTELARKEAHKLRLALVTEGSADGYILRLALRALHYFERSYSYFLVVVDRYPGSPWAPDARLKLRRLEKFSLVYQRICENLSRRSSTRRSSFSIVRGADPS
ncbi:MAG: DnaJ domain-containing protein [Spirochaetota bacterium]